MAHRLLGRIALAAAALAGALALGALAWSAVWTVDQTHEGVVLRFGAVTRSVPPGFHLTLPWPIERMERLSKSEVERMTIGYRLGSPVAPDDLEVEWLTADTNIVELKAMITFSRRNPALYLFGTADLQRVDAQGTTVLPKDRMVRMAAESVMTGLVARMPIDEILSTGKAALQRAAREQTQAILDQIDAGLAIIGVEIVEATAPRVVNSAFQDVASAKADRERRITEADGERHRTMPRARAQADALLRTAETYRSSVLNRANGEAERFRRIHHEIARDPEPGRARIWLETMQKVLPWVDLKVLAPRGDGKTRLYLRE